MLERRGVAPIELTLDAHCHWTRQIRYIHKPSSLRELHGSYAGHLWVQCTQELITRYYWGHARGNTRNCQGLRPLPTE